MTLHWVLLLHKNVDFQLITLCGIIILFTVVGVLVGFSTTF